MKSIKEFISNLPNILQDLKKEPSKIVTVVLGNESCDLDSAICSLVYAHHLNFKSITIPILNIPSEDVPLRTDVKFCLGENLSKIPNRDDLDLKKMSNMKLILVDHHVLQKQDSCLQPRIVEIIDHRQLSALANFPSECKTNLELVGSCSTLIADKLLKEGYQDEFGLELLRATIITDTINLSATAKKATALDVSILQNIEEMHRNLQVSREDVFNDILEVKKDVKGFTVEQLFRKDLKIVPLLNGFQAAVPSTLLLGEDICQKNEHLEQVFDKFCLRYECQLLINIGSSRLQKDILFYYPEEQKNSQKLIDKMVDNLITHEEIDAKIFLDFKTPSPRCVLVKLGNVTFTRKKVLPIICQQ